MARRVFEIAEDACAIAFHSEVGRHDDVDIAKHRADMDLRDAGRKFYVAKVEQEAALGPGALSA